MLTLIFWLLLSQNEGKLEREPARHMDELMRAEPERPKPTPEPQEQGAELQGRVLEQRFNKLVDSLRHFVDAYNRGQGNVWPMKEAEALRKAYRNFERSMPLKVRPVPRSGPTDAGNSR
jgi:hypothetical protein